MGTNRRAVTHFVAGLGTSGTLMGTGRHLKDQNPDIELIAVQPDSPLHGLEGLKHMETAIVPGIFDRTLPDRTLSINTEETFVMAKRLAREEGLFVGISAAAAALAATKVAAQIDHGVIVAIFPDSAMKYLSDRFWTGVKRRHGTGTIAHSRTDAVAAPRRGHVSLRRRRLADRARGRSGAQGRHGDQADRESTRDRGSAQSDFDHRSDVSRRRSVCGRAKICC